MVTIADAFAPIEDLGATDALGPWRWLTGPRDTAKLLTAMGDLIVGRPVGFLHTRESIFHLDTYAGRFAEIARSWMAFKQNVAIPSDEANEWLKLEILVALRNNGCLLSAGECYSPLIPPVLGGSWDVSNFSPSPWTAHVWTMGQLHQQVKGLPEGTPITGIKFERL